MTNNFNDIQKWNSLGYKIDSRNGSLVSPDGELVSLRPKTFELLTLLISKAPNRVTKDEILAHVWKGVVVGEHVIFQSIREIRKAFGHSEPIRTIPKAGYAWVAECTPIETANDSSPNTPETIMSSLRWGIIGSVLCALVILAFIYRQGNDFSGSIVVLPVDNQIEGSDHSWVQLGAMDQLISQLQSSPEHAVLHTDYVLDVLDRAGVAQDDIKSPDVDAIFMVSGASVVIETKLLGKPKDYQLVYILHSRIGRTNGVIFDSNLTMLLSNFVELIGKHTGIQTVDEVPDSHSEFSNELIASALQAKHSDKLGESIQLLEAATLTDPSNLVAHRLLAQFLIEEHQFEDAENVLNTALAQIAAVDDSEREYVRLLFFLSLLKLHQGDLPAGVKTLDLASKFATRINEWLYLAYIEELQGNLALSQGHFSAADASFRRAMDYHAVLKCPLGKSKGLLNLSKSAFHAKEQHKSLVLAEAAMLLTRQRQLTEFSKTVEAWLHKLAIRTP